MPRETRTLVIEDPDRVVLVDFVSAHVVVTLTIRDGTLEIDVMAPRGRDSSEYACADYAFTLPDYDEGEPEEEAEETTP